MNMKINGSEITPQTAASRTREQIIDAFGQAQDLQTNLSNISICLDKVDDQKDLRELLDSARKTAGALSKAEGVSPVVRDTTKLILEGIENIISTKTPTNVAA